MTITDAKLSTTSIHYLRRLEAADYIRTKYGFPCSRQWLAKLAVVGGGPVFRKAGRTPIYALADLDAWAVNRIGVPQRSTSDTSIHWSRFED
jgi:hypothetical protein